MIDDDENKPITALLFERGQVVRVNVSGTIFTLDAPVWDEVVMNEGNDTLAALTLEASLLKGEIDELKTLLDAKEKKLSGTREVILKTLDLMDLDQLKAHGFTFYKKNKSSVTTPKTPEEKAALFAFLESKGIFLEVASVNSQTLNALYKSLAEEAMQAGCLDYEMPGVGKATEYTTLEMRRS